MDYPGINEVLIVTEDQFRLTRKHYNATEESLNRDVDSLINWCKQQQHFPKVEFDREWLERMLLFNKCSMERAKDKIDMYMSSRNMFPEMCLHREPQRIFNNDRKSVICIPFPKLAADNTRVALYRFISSNADYFDHLESTLSTFLALDYRLKNDYHIADRIILDARNFTSAFIPKVRPSVSKTMVLIFRKVYGNRLAGIHLLYMGPMLEYAITLLKMVLPAKLSNRIKVHPDLESLYEDIPKELLPKDYGGDEILTSMDMFEQWQKELCSEKQLEYFKELDKLRSDESKRIGGPINNEMFGIQGSFRTLNLD